MLIEPAILCPCPYRRSIPAHFPKLHITAPNTHHLQPIIGQFLREIAKSNIVGYQTTELAKTKNMVGAQFVSCGKNAIDIQDIVVKEDGAEPGDSAFSMWWWDTTDNKYVYAVWAHPYWLDDGTEDLEIDGGKWADADTFYALVPAGTKNPDDESQVSTIDHSKVFAAGEGFWIQPSVEGKPTVTIAGELVQSDKTAVSLTLAKTKNMVANPFPTMIDIQDIVVKEDGAEPGDSAFSMWWWDTTDNKYIYAVWAHPYWLDDGTEDLEIDGGKWADADTFYALVPAGTKNPDDESQVSTIDHTKTFAAGASFWIQPSVEGVPTVEFKNPLKK